MVRKLMLAATFAAVAATSFAAPAQAAVWRFGGVHGYHYGIYRGVGYWHGGYFRGCCYGGAVAAGAAAGVAAGAAVTSQHYAAPAAVYAAPPAVYVPPVVYGSRAYYYVP